MEFTGMDQDEVEENTNRDFFMTPEIAVQQGLIDGVIGDEEDLYAPPAVTKQLRDMGLNDDLTPNLVKCSPRTAAASVQLPPPVQLDIEDPNLLPQIKAALDLLTKASVQEHLMRGPHHSRIRLLPGEVAMFEQPSSAWPVAKLQELDQVHVQGDNNSLYANATTIITSITEYYRHPQRFISWWAKAVGVVAGGFSKEARKHFPQLVLGRLDYSQPDWEHKWRLPPNSVLRQDGWREEVIWHRGLLGMPAEWEAGVDSIGKGGAGWLPIENRVRYVLFLNRSLEARQTAPHAKPHGNSRRPRTFPRTCPRPFTMLPMVGVRARHFVIAKCVRGLKWCHEVPPNPPPPPPHPAPLAQALLAHKPPAQDPPAPAQDPPPPPPAQDQPPAQPPPGPMPRPQAPPWGRWLDRDTNPCLNFQRIGESIGSGLSSTASCRTVGGTLPVGWRRMGLALVFTLCAARQSMSHQGWTDLKALPPVGKEYQQRYKLVNDRLPKVRQRLHRAAEYRRGIDGRARNNALALVVCTGLVLSMSFNLSLIAGRVYIIVFKHSMAARVLADHPDLSAECKAEQLAGVHNVECVVPAAQLAASVAHQTRGSVQRRWCLVLKDEEVEMCAELDPDAHRLLRTITGSRAMHAMFFPADGVAPMWSETACACVRHMGSKPQQCTCHGASTLSSIPMFGRVTLASDKKEDAECLELLHARAPHIASAHMTLNVHLLKEYARECLGWKGKRLTQKKPLLRADILEHLRWEQEMEEDHLAEVGVDEADDM
ncbi:hypothetical protein QJQ45_021522 [Haematococcus lacustris]|nr:hypothetical protein QJQ45_021522 [Haematococcus lacustris]